MHVTVVLDYWPGASFEGGWGCRLPKEKKKERKKRKKRKKKEGNYE